VRCGRHTNRPRAPSSPTLRRRCALTLHLAPRRRWRRPAALVCRRLGALHVPSPSTLPHLRSAASLTCPVQSLLRARICYRCSIPSPSAPSLAPTRACSRSFRPRPLQRPRAMAAHFPRGCAHDLSSWRRETDTELPHRRYRLELAAHASRRAFRSMFHARDNPNRRRSPPHTHPASPPLRRQPSVAPKRRCSQGADSPTS
jgi:hypothetical protein